MEGIKKSASLLLLLLFVLVLACPVQAEEAEAIPPEFEVTVAGENEAGVYSVGDEVMFEITISMPEDYDSYESYYVEMFANFPDGLLIYDQKKQDFIHAPDLVVVNNGTERFAQRGDFGTTTMSYFTGETEVRIWHSDLKYFSERIDFAGDMPLIIRFYCIIGNVMEINDEDLECKFYLTYTNDKKWISSINPASGGEGARSPVSATEEIPVSVFTGAWNVQLTESGKGMPLSGGKFLLKNSEGRFFADAVGWVESSEEATAYVTDENGMLKIKGVGDGEYILEQTEAPEGYLMPEEPFSFTVSSDANRNGIHGVTVTMGEIKTESVPGTGEPTMVITNEKEFPIGVVICISAAVLALVAVGICVIVKRRK